jgi:hypothetical protein
MGTTTFSGPVVSNNGFQGTFVGATSSTGTITAVSGTAPAAGGTAAFLATSSNVGIYIGSGAPTGVTAAKGSLFINTGATTTTTRLYINTDGGTTWANFTASA